MKTPGGGKDRDIESDFLENAAIAMHSIAPDGTILWANEAALALLGYGREEYVGRRVSEFHADQPGVEDLLQGFSGNNQLKNYEARLKCKDGSIRYVRIYANIISRGATASHARCFLVDVSDKKKAEEASLLLAAIVASSDDAIVSKDLNGVVTSWNKGAERIFGYKAEEIVGRPITLIIPPELHDDEPRILSNIRAGKRIDHFETVRVRKDGERLNVSLTISPVKDHTGKIIGAAKIARDITQQRRMEAALHVSERLASVGRLAATVAHEINNPLEAVTNFIYLAKHHPGLPEKIHRYLSCADEELARVAHIAQQTLGFYRDNSRPVLLDVGDVIEDVLALYERKFKYKSLKLEKRIQPNLAIFTLQGELKQILSNLVANAIDACRDGGKIIISARATRHPRSGRGIRITVADTGNGMSPEHKRRIFTPFFSTKKDVGTGLGLWITKDLVEKKQGHIRFRSSDSAPSGTVMSIFLPSLSSGGAGEHRASND